MLLSLWPLAARRLKKSPLPPLLWLALPLPLLPLPPKPLPLLSTPLPPLVARLWTPPLLWLALLPLLWTLLLPLPSKHKTDSSAAKCGG